MKKLFVAMSVACLGALLLGCGKIDSPAPAAKPAAVKAKTPAAAPAAKSAVPSASAVASEVNDFGDYATGTAALQIKKRQEKALGKLAKQQQSRGDAQ